MTGGVDGSEAGRLVVLSGPSGVGKTALVARLSEMGRCVRAVTATTRKPREGEKDGEDYYFYEDSAAFEADVEQGRFLEYAEVYGRYYGTPLRPLKEQLQRGDTVVLNIDVQGAGTLMDDGIPAIFVFVEPPSIGVLEERLRGRGSDDPESVAIRLETARRELAAKGRFHYRLMNDEFQAAVEELASILERATEPR